MSVSIRFEKDEKRTIVYFSHGGQNLFNAKTFAAWLGGYSLAKITKVGATQADIITDTTERSGDYGSVQLYAQVMIRSAADGKRYAVMCPAPDSSIFDENQEVTPEFGILCANKYSIMAGVTFTFLEGALCGGW
jgi:hypothetical protein